MAYNDRKSSKSRGYGGGSSYINYDAEARSRSKAQLDNVVDSGDVAKYLLNCGDVELMRIKRTTNNISRYGKYDWERLQAMIGAGAWLRISSRIESIRKSLEAKRKVSNAEWDAKRKTDIALMAEKRELMLGEARLTSGYVQTEIASAIRYRESYDRYDGDWLDDPVAALTGQGGFGEEKKEKTGIKIQVSICLDISNSMWYNNLSSVASTCVRDIYAALKMAEEELPQGSLSVNLWTWAGGENGKQVRRLDGGFYSKDDIEYRDAIKKLPGDRYGWTGEDTWIHPLLSELEKFENKRGDFGAYRLDLIISDGVLDHKTDSSKGDAIQERRNGCLQSVVLNFLPLSEWGEYKVPNRCVQYPVTVESLGGMLRSVFGDWLTTIA